MSSPSQSRWTPDVLETLHVLFSAGQSASQIGKELGCSRNAVIGIIHRRRAKEGELRWPRREIDTVNRWWVTTWPKKTKRPVKPARQQAEADKISPPTPKPQKAILRLIAERDRAAPPDPDAVTTLAAVRVNQCRWICGTVDGSDTLMCGSPAQHNRSWCAHHAKLVFEAPAPKPKKARAP